jgi:hypothetical protein
MRQEPIVELSQYVNSLLSSYVAIHDDVFKASLSRVLPMPGFFQAIDFRRHLIEIRGIEVSLESARSEASFLLDKLSGLEKEYALILMLYTDALLKTISLFAKIIEALKLKVDGKRYGWITYRRDVKEYQRSIDKYAESGKELNYTWQRLN